MSKRSLLNRGLNDQVEDVKTGGKDRAGLMIFRISLGTLDLELAFHNYVALK